MTRGSSTEAKLREIRGHSFWDDFGEAIVAVDLGANVGSFASEFLALYPAASLILVEADPYLNGILRRTFASSSQVRLFQGLVGAECSPNARFFLCKVPEGNSVFQSFASGWAPGETREIEAEVISLGALFELARCERVDLLKVDIEGSEWDVLGRLGEPEARRIGQISVEFHDFMDPALRPRTENCIRRLEELGYTALCRPTDRVHGSPYFDCLFYRR
ncbi:MAG: FkbM family methyltransferase [Polyangiaceae bacterium]|nr:FkbM family methyltransferase [Polyangiaceae bacterium]